MSRPTAISPEEQEQIARRIGVLLLQAAPEDWQQLTVEYRATGEYHDLLGEITTQDGSSRSWEPPDDLLAIFEHLREGMYRPDVGTWLSALYVVDRPSSYRIDINFDAEPQWSRPLPRAAYADELRRYPREEDNIPDWMRDYLTGSSSATGQTTAFEPAPAAEPAPTVEAATTEEIPETPAFAASSDEAPAMQATHFRTAMVFDDFDDHGRPVVATRVPVQPDEAAALRQYLDSAPIVLAAQENEVDQLDTDQAASVPATWHTDGLWVWPGAVAFYLAQYGVPPEPDLIEHIRSRRFMLIEVDEHTREAAVSELLDQPVEPPQEPVFDAAPEPAVAPEQPVAVEPEPAGTYEVEPESVPPQQERFTESEPDLNGAEESLPAPEAQHAMGGQTPEPVVEEPPVAEPEPVLALLHDKLTEYGVDSAGYRIGSHSTTARCLVQEGPDWIVTADDQGEEEVRFARQDQAAAYLLGSLLLSRSEGIQPKAAEPEEAAEPAGLSELPRRDAPRPRQPEEPEPHQQYPEQVGGHFLFTANQDQPAETGSEAPSTEAPAPEPQAPAAEPAAAAPEHTPAAAEVPTPGDGAQVGSEAPTRFQPMPRIERPGPPTGPPSPPGGQPAPGPRPGEQLRPNSAPPGQAGAPGQAPPPLPKRPERGAPAPPPEQGGRPPVQPGPAGPQQPGPERRPAPGMPPRQGAAGPPGGPRPPQNGPNNVPQAPQAGRDQQIQPLRGEPPLTLYRDRRHLVLQPGTELDRFGDPSGNVTYAARTPYSQRSLPPQWANRPYFAYRVQRPIQVLRGTAVPWFEQPGGGTAYVLPGAVSDLLADGALAELPANEGQRPPME